MPELSGKHLSRSGKVMVVVATVCAMFGLTVSEAKTETMFVPLKGVPDDTTTLTNLKAAS